MHISRKSSAEPTLGADAMKSGARDARRKAQSPVPELNSTRDRSLRRSTVLRISLYAVLVIIGLQTLAILVLNAGHLVFTVDDAYIHLALAENLLQGHYGVNLTEFSSPASSVLWPFLIAPFSTTAVASYVVLLINAGSALLTVLVIWHILSSSSVYMSAGRAVTADAPALDGLPHRGVQHHWAGLPRHGALAPASPRVHDCAGAHPRDANA